MHRRNIVALLLVVGLLVVAQRWAGERETEEQQTQQQQLALQDLLYGIDEADFERLARVRIDNLERTVQVTMERDSAGSWYLTDPIAWPAEVGTLGLLFQTLATDRGQPSEGVRREDVGLDPPRALCELDFVAATDDQTPGVVGRFRLEIGAVDLDSSRLFVAVTDTLGTERILRANRSLESIFQRFVPDYRSKAILRLDAAEVVEVHRRGPRTLASPDEALSALGAAGVMGPARARTPNPLLPPAPFDDLEFRFASGSRGWQASAPFEGALDPQAAAMLIVSLARLDARGFHAEQAPDLAQYGFDEPELELELITADREVHRVAFARSPRERRDADARQTPPQGSEWLCMVEGLEPVFEVDGRIVMLCSGSPDAFADARIVRGATAAARGLVYAAGGREVSLRREGQGWRVSGRTADGGTIEDLPASEERVEEFLQGLRGVELGDLHPGASLAPTLVAEFVHLDVAGEQRGGSFGPIMGASGDSAYGFQRLGEQLVSAVDDGVTELLRTPPEDFLQRELFAIDELRMGAVELRYREASLRFERDPQNGRWSPAGQEQEARAFANLVDRLRSQRALSFAFAPEGQVPEPLVDPVSVRIEVLAELGPRGREGYEQSFELAVDPAGVELLEYQSSRARVYPGLWAALVGLFDS